MTLISLSDCCRQLGIDGKTLRRWLEQAQLSAQVHRSSARLKGLTADQLRWLAHAHHRSLTPLTEALSMPAAPAPAEPPPPLPHELLEDLQQLRTLPAQLAALQQQLADLCAWLHQAAQPPALAQDGRAAVTKTSARTRSATDSQQKPPQPPRHVLPLVESAGQGHYVVICPKQGLLPLEPESPEWFAWLATLSAFRGCRESKAA
jgi:transposase-like protein